MLTYINQFIKRDKGSLPIEFAGVFFAFILIIFGTYDIFNLISLQTKLESTNYNVATLFRERTSNLYPLISDDPNKGDKQFSLCQQIDEDASDSCYNSYEFFDSNQVQEAQELASKLLNRDVSIRIDGLFIFQSRDYPADISKAKILSYSFSSCGNNKGEGECPTNIKQFLDNRSNMADMSIDDKNYTKLVPFVKRVINSKFIEKNGYNITGRFVPLYRITMCVNKDESLFLAMIGNRDSQVLPNLCSEVVALSRCNDLLDPTESCPIYAYGDW